MLTSDLEPSIDEQLLYYGLLTLCCSKMTKTGVQMPTFWTFQIIERSKYLAQTKCHYIYIFTLPEKLYRTFEG